MESKRFENKVVVKDPRRVSESICAMANTESGSIEIGKDNEGELVGLDLKEVDEIQKRLHDAKSTVKPSPHCDIEVVHEGENLWIRMQVEKMP